MLCIRACALSIRACAARGEAATLRRVKRGEVVLNLKNGGDRQTCAAFIG